MAKRDGELKRYDFSSCVGRITRKMAIGLPQLVRNCQYLKIVDSAIEIYAGPWIQLFLVLFSCAEVQNPCLPKGNTSDHSE